MKAAQVASLKTIIDDGGIKVPIFTEPRGPYYKVWPINQFHSIDISQSVKRCFFSNTQSRFASVVFESVLGGSAVLGARRKVEGALKAAVLAKKALQGFETQTRKLLRQTKRNNVVFNRASAEKKITQVCFVAIMAW